jgi:Polyketide cyclase / dehydrase and lipid transport
MAPAITSTVVDRPAAEVFAYGTDPTRFHKWQQGVTGGHLDQPGRPQVGAKCLTTRRIGGANRTVTSELTHIDPGCGSGGDRDRADDRGVLGAGRLRGGHASAMTLVPPAASPRRSAQDGLSAARISTPGRRI